MTMNRVAPHTRVSTGPAPATVSSAPTPSMDRLRRCRQILVGFALVAVPGLFAELGIAAVWFQSWSGLCDSPAMHRDHSESRSRSRAPDPIAGDVASAALRLHERRTRRRDARIDELLAAVREPMPSYELPALESDR